MNAAAPPRRLSAASFAALFAVMMMTAGGNTALISVMPAIGREIRIPDYLVASIFSLSALLWAVSAPFWARLSDRQGRKPYVLLGMAGFVFSMLTCGLVVLAGIDQLAAPLLIFAAFFVIRSTYGLFGSASAAAAQAYVADNSDGERRVRGLATLSGAVNLGTIIGPAIAPFLVLPVVGLAGPTFVFAAAGGALLLACALAIPRDRPLAREKGAATTVRLRDVWRDPKVRPHLTYAFVIASAQAINTYTLGFLVIDRLGKPPIEAQGAVGLIMAAGAAAGLLAQWGFVTVGRMAPRAMVRWGAFISAGGNAVIAVNAGFAVLLGAFALASFGYGLGRPGAAAGASLAADAEAQGAVAGAISSIAGASIAVPPVLAVALYQEWRAGPFALCAVASLALLVYALRSAPLSGAIVSDER